MKKPENMTRDELIGAVNCYRRILFPKPKKCLDPELHEVRPCECDAEADLADRLGAIIPDCPHHSQPAAEKGEK